ncbi:hypothetical protein [Algivirga pacifica]|uniref:Lipoprotein n=1 Tax=Algivirga pacifica TaxID=1162670 RepID=A0ABP9DM81_9BACT
MSKLIKTLIPLILLIATTIVFSCKTNQPLNTQLIEIDETKIGIESEAFRGTIYTEKYPHNYLFLSEVDSTSYRWTPSQDEILKTESILRNKLKESAQYVPMNGASGCPIIHKKLKHYYRQYVAFKNEKGERIIHINCHWDKKRNYYAYDTDYTLVMDGCSYYWSVSVNLDTGELFDLWVNGVA